MNKNEFFAFSTFLSVVILAIGKPLRKPRISLSPSSWDAEIFRRLETISLRKNSRPKPLVFSKNQGIVSGTTSVLAVHAGTQALRNGGNAMDACLTSAMAEVSLTAGSKVSFAGVTNILYYDHVTKRTHNLDAGWKIPKYRNMDQPPTMETLGDSVLVPGFIAGMHEAAEFAKLSLSSLLEPALYFAEEGFKMPHELSKMMHRYYKRTLLRTEEGKTIFTNPDTKSSYKPGKLFRQPQLAHFIKNLQTYGKNYMYKGDWARQFIKTIKQHGGRMKSHDLSRYEPRWLEPATTTYSGYHVTTTGSKWGGVELIEMLQLLKSAEVSRANDSYLTNSTTLYALMSISQYSQFISDYLNAKREGAGTIKEFLQVNVTPKGRQSNISADTIWGHLCNFEGVELIRQSFTELLSQLPYFDQHRELKRGSSGIVAIDNKGNICAMSHSANSNPWGTGLFVEGIALPHSGAVFQDFLGRFRPGSHIPSGLQPVIIFREKLKEKKKKTIIVKETEEKPVRVTNAPTYRSTERDMGPIGPRGIWETADHMPRVTKPSRYLPPTNEIVKLQEQKLADNTITRQKTPTEFPSFATESSEPRITATKNHDNFESPTIRPEKTPNQMIAVTENSLKRKLSELSRLSRTTRPTRTSEVPNTDNKKPPFEMGPLIVPRDMWGSSSRLIAVPKHSRPTFGSLRKTAKFLQSFIFTKSQPPTTGFPVSTVDSLKGRKSFKSHHGLRNWNDKIDEDIEKEEEQKEIEEEKEEEEKENLEDKDSSVEEKRFDLIEEEDEESGGGTGEADEEELFTKEEDRDERLEEEGQDNEPLSIGGLYTESDLDTILPRPFTPRGHYRILNQSRENWFRNFVRQILKRQQKRRKLRRNKIYRKKKRVRKRWSKPLAALSVIGQSAPEALLLYINNLIDNKMDSKQASDTPMFFTSMPGSHRQTVRVERFIFSNGVINEVRSRGMNVKEVHNKEGRVISGEGAVVSVTDRQGSYGCSHPNSEGYAESQ